MFGSADKSGDGILDRGEIAEVATSLGSKLSAKELDKAMAIMDEDGSGEVDFEEFYGWWSKQDGSGGSMFYSFTNKGHLTRLTQKIDGARKEAPPPYRKTLGYKKLIERDKKKGPTRTEKLLEAAQDARGHTLRVAFKSFDTDGGGSLDRDELSALMSSLGVDPSEEELSAAMRSIDTDGGGEVEFEEFKDWWDKNLEADEASASRSTHQTWTVL